MSQTLYLSEGTAARRRVYIRLVLASDGVTPATSADVTAAAGRFMTNGADGGATTNNIVEIDSTDLPGEWYLELTSGELTTLGVGRHRVRFKETDSLESIGGYFDIVAYDPWAAGFPVLSIANNAITASAIASDAITAAKIAADALTAAKVAADVGTELANALLDLAAGVETGLTLRQHMRLSASALYGKSSTGGTTYRDTGDSKDRIVATVDGSGNRTAVTLDAS